MTTASWTVARNARRWLSVILLVASSWGGVAQAEPQLVTNGDIEYSIDAVPSWVSRTTVQESPPGIASAAAPIRNLLLDFQLSLLGSAPQLYIHQVRAAQTFGAVDKIANVIIAFSPDSERLTVHALSLLRGGQRMDKLPTVRVELLRGETEREAPFYDAVVTAAFLLDDVRVGDIVEAEYTLSTETSVERELYNSTFPLATAEPVDTLKVRVLSVTGRPLRYSVLFADVTPRVTRHEDVTELTLERTAVPAITQEEPSKPEDALLWPHLRVIEYVIWSAGTRASSCTGRGRKSS